MVAYSFKRRFVTPIQVGLGQIEHIHGTEFVPKRQTIRAVGRRRHARAGETLQLYHGQRSRDCFKIGEAKCAQVQPIRIFVATGIILVGDRPAIDTLPALDEFARADGFRNWPDMQEFWREEHGELTRLGPFVGLLIEWVPL